MLYLFNYAGKDTSLKHFLLTLAALLKKTTRNPDSLLSLQILAGQLGVTEMAIEYGLGWLEAHGDITIAREKDSDTLRIEFTGLKDSSSLKKFTTLLEKTLDEIAAFREYYSRTDSENLLRK